MGKYDTTLQANAQLAVFTDLGEDKLLLTAFSGSEEISRLFSYELVMTSSSDSIDPKAIIGTNVTFRIKTVDQTADRFFNGYVARFRGGERSGDFFIYTAEVVPWFWFLTQTTDCKIFQGKTVPQIVEAVFGTFGFTDFDMSKIDTNAAKHPVWDYCVQYRESAYNFVCRLLEQEGIYYYFKHEKEKHTMILSDQTTGYFTLRGTAIDQFAAPNRSPSSNDGFRTWNRQFEFTAGKSTLTDYNFIDFPARANRTPFSHLVKSKTTSVTWPGINLTNNSKYEIYDFPAEIDQTAECEKSVETRMQEEEVTHNVVMGESDCRDFALGGIFTIGSHVIPSETGQKCVLTAVQHSAEEPTSFARDAGEIFRYSNSFSAIPSTVRFVPQRITPKPAIQGSQTAVVVGNDGDEILTDDYGRVKVQFYWDRVGQRRGDTSCFIRCAQISAGNKWGAMFIPRVGQEVVVSFLEGDPDQPLITGVVYNAEQMPHYALPAHKTRSYIKTNSTPGGEGYNEIRIEDKKGEEQIFIHSQRNMDVRVLNERMDRVILHQHQIVGYDKDGEKNGDRRELVYQDHHENVKRNHVEKVEGHYYLTVGCGDAEDPGNLHLRVEKQTAFQTGSYGVSVGENYYEKIGGDHHQQITGKYQNKVIGNVAVESAGEIHLKAMSKLILECPAQISLVVGGNFIDINPGGVFIKGAMVMINSGGSAGSGSGCSPENPATPDPAVPTAPTIADDSTTGVKSTPF